MELPAIDERFELRATLGRGGMGVVYRAFDKERGVEVALKTLRGITPDSVLRFKNEFRALRDVRHPNLVELGELFENAGTWFFTMELVRGVQLLDWVRATALDEPPTTPSEHDTTRDADPATDIDAPLSIVARDTPARRRRLHRLAAPCCDLPRLRVALAGLARGLAALHAAGKVHRDIKPSNVLVDEDGRVALLDFGVVAELHAGLAENLLIGTLQYMAPEQARGDQVGAPADWYAVGVVIYQAITGELPVTAGSQDELISAKQATKPVPPSDVVDGVPQDLDALAHRLLDPDAERRPVEAEILAILGVDREREPAWPSPRAPDQLFVGRRAELAELRAAFDASRTAPVLVVVEGESGVGKSTLVARFGELARDERAIVLHGRCHEREHVAFNALDGVIDDLARTLMVRHQASIERLIPEHSAALLAVFPALRAVGVLAEAAKLDVSASGAPVRVRAFSALRVLLARLGRLRPIVIAIDDLQWADADSTALLGDLLHPGSDAPAVLAIATARLRVASRFEQIRVDARRIVLAGLGDDDAAELLDQVGAARRPEIIAESGGHPLFLRELAREPVAGARLEEVLWARVQRLGEPARQLLAAVAIAGVPIPRQVAIAAAGVVDAEAPIAELVAEHLVRVHGPRPHDAIEPFHDRVHAAVAAHTSAERQREVHLALARTLEAFGASPAELLACYDAAGDIARATTQLVAAAESARGAFAFERAAALFRRALAAPDLTRERRSWLLVQLGEALANDGRTGEAAEQFLEASRLEVPDSDRQLDLLRRAAERFLMAGRLEQGLATTRSVLARAGMVLPTTRVRTLAGILWNQVRMRGRTLAWTSPRRRDTPSLPADICWSIGAGLAMVDSLLGAYFSGRAARLALAEGSPLQIVRGMVTATIGASLLDRRERSHKLLGAAVRAADEDDSPLAHWYVRLGRTAVAFMLDNDFRRAEAEAYELERDWYSAGHGPAWETDVAMHFHLASQQMLGKYREMSQRVAGLVRDAHAKGDLFQEVTLRVRFAVRHLCCDQPAVARDDVVDALGSWLPGHDGFGNQHAWALWSRTRIALYAGELDTLDRELGADWHRMQRSLVGRIPLLRTEWYHVYGTFLLGQAIAAKRRGNASEHTALCRRAERIADRTGQLGFPAALASEQLLRAAIAWVRGDPDVIMRTQLALDEWNARELHAFSAFLKRRLGEAIGGDEGAALVTEGDRAARQAGFADPARGAELAMPTGRYG